jgi:UDP-N-acetylglucosamine--N-acetylmuramyl-(pentapeptide) pyrophosphoryl-undecaprenol N-acetylglucosamine transferase
MRVMITGGGTGGHTSPAFAILEELKTRDPRLELQWVGCKDSIEERLCASHSIPFRSVPVKGWPRGSRVKQIWAAFHLARGIAASFIYLRKFRPQVVVGVGGYVSVPLMWTAQRVGIPTILHEQNKQLGMANRLLAQRAHQLLLSFPDTVGDFPEDRAEVVGNPVRAGFSSAPSREEACTSLGLDPNVPVVLVCGGSQGAQSINRAMMDVVSSAERGAFQLIWMTGQAGAAEARECVQNSELEGEVYTFIDDMVTACAAARLIVSRSGASTTAEIAEVGRASILIPYPHATDNHQEKNARAFEEAGAAVVLLDAACTGEELGGMIEQLLRDESSLDGMEAAARGIAKPVAVERIVEHVLAAVFGADSEQGSAVDS